MSDEISARPDPRAHVPQFAFGKPSSIAQFRHVCEDFIVRETLGFTPCGEGEHIYVQIQKRGENTAWIAQKLAAFFKLKLSDVGYSGLKDRRAVTTQWFSLHLPAISEPLDWQAFVDSSESDCQVVTATPHTQKLRRGMHSHNHFSIRLREVSDIADVESRLLQVQLSGVPNYFGEQRFGKLGNNLVSAQAWIDGKFTIKDRHKKSLIMSAARSYLFNLVLSLRVQHNNWHSPIEGDALLGTSPSGPLWGRGKSPASDIALTIENTALASWNEWKNKLEHVGLSHERRRLRLQPGELTWQKENQNLCLEFTLPPGEFATSVLRELCQLQQTNNDLHM